MTTEEIIKALGGSAFVAGQLGCSQAAVSNWRKQGIPYRHWMAICAMARADSGINMQVLAAERKRRNDAIEQAKTPVQVEPDRAVA